MLWGIDFSKRKQAKAHSRDTLLRTWVVVKRFCIVMTYQSLPILFHVANYLWSDPTLHIKMTRDLRP